MFWFKKKKKIPKNKLIFAYDYVVHGAYSIKNKYKFVTITEIITKFKSGSVSEKWGVYIKCEYNGIIYPFFDLDSEEHKDTFVKIYKNNPYVLFQTSDEHYWGILGTPNNDIFNDTIWLTCNDPKFVNIAKERGHFRIRGLYKNLNRKPTVIDENGDLSENFKEFISKVESFHSNEGLELSILKYKDTKMMLMYDRRKKLKKLEQLQNK